MDLVEYQAKELFGAHGVPITPGEVVTTADDAAAAAARIGGRVVVKAQVKTGGRGKAGGVQVADGPDQARERAAQILGLSIKGHVVRELLVVPASDIAQEYYLSFLVDRADRGYLGIASVSGGMDIEQVAHETPKAVARLPIDPASGFTRAQAEQLMARAGLPADVRPAAADAALALWQVFVAEDATLVEVNPLVKLGGGGVEAVDGKVTLDDNAAFRHPEHAKYADDTAEDPLERKAKAKHLNYVKLDGQVGVIGNGAGLVMSTLDVVARAGQEFGGVRPANFLDIGGGASAQVMADGLDVVLGDPAVRCVFVNVFGGITSCDAVANGVIEAFRLLADRGDPVDKPLVVRLDGNNAEVGRQILDGAALPGVERVDTMDGAARRAAELAAAAGPAGEEGSSR